MTGSSYICLVCRLTVIAHVGCESIRDTYELVRIASLSDATIVSVCVSLRLSMHRRVGLVLLQSCLPPTSSHHLLVCIYTFGGLQYGLQYVYSSVWAWTLLWPSIYSSTSFLLYMQFHGSSEFAAIYGQRGWACCMRMWLHWKWQITIVYIPRLPYMDTALRMTYKLLQFGRIRRTWSIFSIDGHIVEQDVILEDIQVLAS